MTSFMIKPHISRKLPDSWLAKNDSGDTITKHHPITESERDCAFCRIIRGELPAYKVYEDDSVVAFLDILPLRPGHTLVIPKAHISRLSELDPYYAGRLGESVSRVSNALVKALDNSALNVVCNQEYAQAVPHVHYHIIPAPDFRNSGSSSSTSPAEDLESSKEAPASHKDMLKLEFHARSELDEDEGKSMSARIAAKM